MKTVRPPRKTHRGCLRFHHNNVDAGVEVPRTEVWCSRVSVRKYLAYMISLGLKCALHKPSRVWGTNVDVPIAFSHFFNSKGILILPCSCKKLHCIQFCLSHLNYKNNNDNCVRRTLALKVMLSVLLITQTGSRTRQQNYEYNGVWANRTDIAWRHLPLAWQWKNLIVLGVLFKNPWSKLSLVQ